MKFSVPTNWQKDLIPKIKNLEVEELYGKLGADFIGGGRASCVIPNVSKTWVASYIKEVHRAGIKFDYLLNATCLDNLEWTRKGQKKIHALLNWLITIGVDYVTVSIPYLLQLIKRHYPQLKVSVSTMAGVNTIERAKYWEDFGADEICLLYIDVNRNFRLLKEIRKNLTCRISLIANNDCLYHCPFNVYHPNWVSHSSQALHPTKGFAIDYCYLFCRYIQIKEPVNFIRGAWIRPEDIHYYEEIGVDKIKLVNRTMPTDQIAMIINAYSKRCYDGNLLDLFSKPSKNIMLSKLNLLHKLRYFFRPLSVNIFRFVKYKDLFNASKVYIDNKALNGFLEHFLNEDCSLKSCQRCGYCEKIANKVVRIEPDYQREIVIKYHRCLDELISGKLFTYS